MTDRSSRFVYLVIVVALALLTALSGLAARNAGRSADATKDLSATLAKRSPVTQFDAAAAFHEDCRKDLEDAYFGAIGRAVNPDSTQADRAAAARQAAAEAAQLTDVEQVCPVPLPAVVTPDGVVAAPPVIQEQYLCQIERRPCAP